MLTLAVTLPNVLVVNPQVPARNMDELVAYLRTRPARPPHPATVRSLAVTTPDPNA